MANRARRTSIRFITAPRWWASTPPRRSRAPSWGRGVHTLLAPEFAETQEGTLHFRHLQQVNGGLLHVASDLRSHVAGLEAAILDPDASGARGRRFVEAFVRPFG